MDFTLESTVIVENHDTIHGYFNIFHVDSKNKHLNPRGFRKISVDLANNPHRFMFYPRGFEYIMSKNTRDFCGFRLKFMGILQNSGRFGPKKT